MNALPPALLIGAGEVDRLLGVDTARAAVREAFRLLGAEAAPRPVIAGCEVPGGGFHWKAAVWPGPPVRFAAKLNANFPANPARGLPTIQGHVALIDAANGRLLALMDSGVLTARRTAAATAVAAEHLARREASVLAVVGCGVQGVEHVAALRAVRPVRRVRLADPRADRAEALARRCREDWALDAVVTGVADAVDQADLVVTCTPADRPVLEDGMVAPGAFIAGVGADAVHKHELAPTLMQRARVVVDVLAQAAAIGDLHHALAAGVMRPEDVDGELGAIVAGRAPGRRTSEEVIVFDSTGMALQDAAAAVAVYEAARAGGGGRALRLG